MVQDSVDDQLHEDGLRGRELLSTETSRCALVQDDDDQADKTRRGYDPDQLTDLLFVRGRPEDVAGLEVLRGITCD